MSCFRSPFARAAVSAFLLAAAGCSLPRAIDQSLGAGKALSRVDDAAARGDYDAALASYLSAKRLLITSRQEGYRFFTDRSTLDALDEKIAECERLAGRDGLVRVGARYLAAADLGEALAGSLRELFRENPSGDPARERVVPETLNGSCVERSDGRFDVTLRVVLRDAEDGADFGQDAWGIVRFLMEGAWGHGFCAYSARKFPHRPWMGRETRWGSSRAPDAENRFVGLKDRIGRLTVAVSRGRLVQEPGDGFGPRGHRTLSAVGPYWREAPYMRYTMDSADAARLNWGEADRIPDATLYGLIRIASRSDEETGIEGGAGDSGR